MGVRLLLLDGQGSSPSISTSTNTGPSSPTSVPPVPPPSSSTLAALFLRQAHVSLRARFTSLSASIRSELEADSPATAAILTQLREGHLCLPTTHVTLLRHPLISLPSLYVAQVVRILEEVEVRPEMLVSGASDLEIIGYSSGLLPALLVATSLPALSPASESGSAILDPASQFQLLSNALALFDLTVVFGIHTQLARSRLHAAAGLSLDDPAREREWSVVVFGVSRQWLQGKVDAWNATNRDALLHVYLTAQTTPTCHTVSGVPSALRQFVATINPASSSLTSSPNLSYPASSNGSFTDSDPSIHSRSPSSASTYSIATSATSASSSQLDFHASCPVVVSSPSDAFPTALNVSVSSSVSVLSNESTTPTMPAMSSSFPFPPVKPSAVKPLNIFTLFHADIPQLRTARDCTLNDLFTPCTITNNELTTTNYDSHAPSDNNVDSSSGYAYANETLKTLSALRLTRGYKLYDTHTGDAIPGNLTGKDLVERILDMILLERVEFVDTLRSVGHATHDFKLDTLEILNFGPGTGLARVAMRALKERVSRSVAVSLNDVSSAAATPTSSAKEKPAQVDGQEPIAIVGMAVNFPGARDTQELWNVLEKGINTVEEIPATRFSISPYTSENANPNRKLKTRFGNFLPDSLHSSFDNAFFHISPREARSIDPQMRVLMRVGLQAMEAAGLVVDEFKGEDEGTATESEGVLRSEDVGCYVGVATNDYVFNLRNEVGVHYATGTLPAFLAGRVAYALHLSGPSLVINTACSSSAVAVHQAVRALLSGECKAALAGGVNVVTSPDMYLGLDRAHFLSPSGNCKPWDASADGYCRSEGCGIFVLKRLSDAVSASDNILGVIRGSEVNQSAAAVSITRPHAPTQQSLFRSLLAKSGVKPEEISVVEAHGTGTQAGDPEELKSLRNVLSPNGGSERSKDNMLTVTSIKGNIGHAEAASGAASLAKLLLMFRHGQIPPQPSLVNLNPKIEPLENDFTRINAGKECIEWTANFTGKRIALLNNFGAAGSNVAMIVEEAPVPLTAAGEAKGAADQVLVAFSAETEEALIRLRDSYIANATDASLVDFAYTATARRKLRQWRMAVTADSAAGLAKALQDAKPIRAPQTSERSVVFVFSGQGGQHLGMGRQLYEVSATFRHVVDVCHRKLLDWGYPGVLSIICAELDGESGLAKEEELVAYQCTMFVLECALYRLWKSWGIEPDAVVGHSLGEYAALVAAGVIRLNTGLRLVAHRARLMTQRCAQNTSGMMVVRTTAQVVSQAIFKLSECSELSIACYNSAKDVVVGGPHQQLVTLKANLESTGTKCISVNVPFAYHTAAMEPILDELTAFASEFDFKAPKIPVVSNVVGRTVMPGDASVFDGAYFAKHCRQPVQFEEGINDLGEAFGSIGAFVELGPHPTTLPMVAHLSSSTGALSLHTLHRKFTARTSLSVSFARLFTLRGDIVWGKVFRELYPTSRCIEIPGYPLQETEFWVPYVEEAAAKPAAAEPLQACVRFPFLGSWTQKPSSQEPNVSEFETPIDALAEYITGHSVSSFPLCPASVYFELALSAATCTLENSDESFANDVLTLSEVQFTHPLVFDASVPLVIRTTINLHPRGGKHAGTFTISSFINGKERHSHCTGFFQRRLSTLASSKLQLHTATVERGKQALLNPADGVNLETLRTRTLYDLVFPRVVQYSKLYQVIRKMTLDERTGEGFATIQLSDEQVNKAFVAQPIFVDALLHAAGFLINSQAANGDAYICGQVDSTKMLYDIDYSATYEIYCTTTNAGDGIILADAWAVQTGEAKAVVAHMKRMRFTRLRLNSLTKILSRSAGSTLRNSSPPMPMNVKFADRPVTPPPSGRPVHRPTTPSTMSSVTAVNCSDLASEVTKFVAETCGVPVGNVSLNSNIADLGVDSLIWIELIGHLKTIVPGAPLEVSDLMLSNTVGDLVTRLSKFDVRSSPGSKSLKVSFADDEKLSRSEVSRVTVSVHDDLSIGTKVKGALGKVLDMDPRALRDEDELDALGLDSLGSIEALHDLQEEFHLSLPQDLFQAHTTIGAVLTYITNARAPRPLSRQSSYSTFSETEPAMKAVRSMRTLLPIHSSSDDVKPLFLVHDGSGLGHCYARIGEVGRSLWGISNPKLLSGDRWEGGIPEMAAHYLDLIKPNIGEKGCILGGWSFGGVVAFHMACELMRAGVKVAGVVLIDSPSPYTQKPLPEELIEAVLEAETVGANEQQANLVRLARIQMTHSTNTLVAYNPPSPSEYSALPNVTMIRCSDSFPLSDIAGINKSKRLSFLEDRKDPKDLVRDWERLVGKEVPIFDIPGHHFEVFSPSNSTILTQQLNKAIAHLEAL